MAATNDTISQERNRGWYQDDLTEVNEPIRKLLENYSRIPSSEVVKHVNAIVSLSYELYHHANITTDPRIARTGVCIQPLPVHWSISLRKPHSGHSSLIQGHR